VVLLGSHTGGAMVLARLPGAGSRGVVAHTGPADPATEALIAS